MEPAHPISSWSTSRKLGFRFAFLYWLLYCLPFPLSSLPWTSWITDPYGSASDALVLWSARHVLGIEGEIPTAPTGSGDGMLSYAYLACMSVLRFLMQPALTSRARVAQRRRRAPAWPGCAA